MSTTRVPVVLFFYKRRETTLRVLDQIARASPSKLYLIGDGPRTPEEEVRVTECRDAVDSFVETLDCEVVRHYADQNRGVYANIAGGATWVFQRETRAIFLEDDNVPDPSFFQYCEEMLDRYEAESRVVWICGTNYLGHYSPMNGGDYVFTQHMLPCGWASWADKFSSCYDGELALFNTENIERVRPLYRSKKFYAYDMRRISGEHERHLKGERFLSWDYQMAFSLRVYDKFGIAPSHNLIMNVGDDADATHGGTSRFNTMTNRFCGIPTKPLSFPLKHPTVVALDPRFEARTTRVVLPPSSRLRRLAVATFKRAFSVPPEMPTREALQKLRAKGVHWREGDLR